MNYGCLAKLRYVKKFEGINFRKRLADAFSQGFIFTNDSKIRENFYPRKFIPLTLFRVGFFVPLFLAGVAKFAHPT